MNILSALRSKTSADSKKAPKPSTSKQTKGIEIKSQRELDYMRESSRIVATVLKEISEITGVSINTALGRMRYALMNLRKVIDKHQIVLTN